MENRPGCNAGGSVSCRRITSTPASISLFQLEQEGFGIFALVEGEATEAAPPPARPGDWDVSDSETARTILSYLGIGSDATLEPEQTAAATRSRRSSAPHAATPPP